MAAKSDVTTEFMSLCEHIALNVISVNKSWQELNKILKLIGSNNDTASLRDEAHKIQTSANEKVYTTQKDLKTLAVVVRRGDKLQELQLDRLKEDFETVAKHYSECQKHVAAKLKNTLLVNASQQDDINHDESRASIEGFHQEQQQIDLQHEQRILLEREELMKQILNDVIDINKIMKDINDMVIEQGTVVDVIETNVATVVEVVESGGAELEEAAKYQSKYRKKVCILLIIVVIMGLIVIGFVV